MNSVLSFALPGNLIRHIKTMHDTFDLAIPDADEDHDDEPVEVNAVNLSGEFE